MDRVKAGAFIPLPLVPTVLVGAMVGGKPNYAAVGFVGGANIDPPVVGVSLNHRHHTVKGILEHGTFSVNVPSSRWMVETDFCGLVSGAEADKSGVFPSFFGELGTAPMADGMPIVCECRYGGVKAEFSMDAVYFGEVVQVYVDPSAFPAGGRADLGKIDPLLLGLDRRYYAAGRPLGKAYAAGRDYAPGQGAGAGPAPRTVDRPPLHELAIQCGHSPAAIGKAIDELRRYAAARGTIPVEGPYMRRAAEPGAGVKVAVGFTFAEAVPGEGRIEAARMPGGRYFERTHVGPYGGIPGTLAALQADIHGCGREAEGAVYQFFIDDPQFTSPGALRTSIMVRMKE